MIYDVLLYMMVLTNKTPYDNKTNIIQPSYIIEHHRTIIDD